MIETEELITLVPHRGKMLLLSRVIGYNLEERSIEAEYHITEDCLFYDPQAAGVPAWVGLEFMAQAIAAISGIWSREKGEPPKMGFILSVSAMQIETAFFRAGSILNIKMKEAGRMDSVYNFDGEIRVENEKAVQGKLTVLELNDEQAQKLIKEHGSIG
jgi:predicted hotdog family 3-hydroxylacyl-ACP dehydratase